MFLICGLGNPGRKYFNTRHNIGFKLLDNILNNYSFILIKKDKNKEIYKGEIGLHKCMLLKPLTFVNLSGIAVKEVMNFYKINRNKLFVIHDDLDLKTAKVKIKIGGGNGGHNGLLSIDNMIGNNYNRIRLGINHPGNKDLVSSYVLKKFSDDEIKKIDKKLKKITEIFQLVLQDTSLFLTKLSEKDINGL